MNGRRNRFHRSLCVAVIVALGVFCGCAPRSKERRTGGARFLVLTQIPTARMAGLESIYPGNATPPVGSRVVLVDLFAPDRVEVLSAGFAAAADPCISYAGDTLVFAGKKNAEDPWNVWIMPLVTTADGRTVSGGEPVQVTHDMADCREPFFMALGSITAPEFADRKRWIGFTSTAHGTYDERGRGPTTALYCQSLGPIVDRGIVTWRTTFNLNHDFSPTMVGDGRVLFTSLRYDYGGEQRGTAGLLASNWAGTGLNPFFGNHGGAFVKSMACEYPNRSVIFVESDGRTPLNAGRLARVWMRRPMHTYERISDLPGRFLTPHALPDGGVVVAYAADGLNYGIYRYDPDARRLGVRLFDDPARADVDPQPVWERPEPQGRITIVVDSKETGDIQCLSVYDSDHPQMRRVEPGTVRRVRVLEGVPRTQPGMSGLDTLARSPALRIIGEAPVEPDGSFYLTLPADTPILFQLLDEDGLSVMGMQSWVWVRRGARRGCIGCHENKELAPVNRLTDALGRARPHVRTPLPEERRTVDFRNDVYPIAVRKCVLCHTRTHPAMLELSRTPELLYERIMTDGRYVKPFRARESRLAWHVMGRRLDGEPGDVRRMPVRGTMTDEEMRTFCEWIDLGARFDNRSSASASTGGSEERR